MYFYISRPDRDQIHHFDISIGTSRFFDMLLVNASYLVGSYMLNEFYCQKIYHPALFQIC